PGGPGPDSKNPAGDGFLMKRGFVVIWSGWIGELLPGDHRLLLQAPQARDGKGNLLGGVVRYEMSTDKPVKSLPLSRRDGHGSYPPTQRGEDCGTLTKRLHEADEREVILQSKWKLDRKLVRDGENGGVPGTLPEVRLVLEGGFEPGYLYE